MSNENGNAAPKTVHDLPLAARAEITLEDVRALEIGLEQQLKEYNAIATQLNAFAEEIKMTRAAISFGKMILAGQMPSQKAKVENARNAAQTKRAKRQAKRAQPANDAEAEIPAI